MALKVSSGVNNEQAPPKLLYVVNEYKYNFLTS